MNRPRATRNSPGNHQELTKITQESNRKQESYSPCSLQWVIFIDPLNPATKFLFLPYGNQGGREYSIFAEFHVRLLLLSSSCPGDIITIGVRKYAGDQIST